MGNCALVRSSVVCRIFERIERKPKVQRVGVTALLACSLTACGGFDRSDAEALLESEPLPADYDFKVPRTIKNCLEQEGLFSKRIPIGVTQAASGYMSTNGFGNDFSFGEPSYYKDVAVTGLSGSEENGRFTIEFTALYDIPAVKGTTAEQCFEGFQKPTENRVVAVEYDDGWRLVFPGGL